MLFVGALAAVAIAWCVSSLWLPFGWDHGLFATVSDVIRRGGMPYRDIWEIKGPLALYLYAVAQGVGHPQMWGIRLLDVAFLAMGAYAGWRLVRELAGPVAALFGVATIVLGFAGFGHWYTAQPDGWAAQLLIVLVWLLAAPQRSVRRIAVAGAVLGALCLMKPTYLLFALLFVPVLVRTGRSEQRVDVNAAGAAMLAFAIPVALLLGYLASRGALAPLIDQHLIFNRERLASDPSLQMPLSRVALLTMTIVTASPELAAALPLAMLGIGVSWRRDRRVLGSLLVLWFVLALATVALQRKFLLHNYSWHPAYPPVLLGAAIGLGFLWRQARTHVELAALAWCSALLVAYHVAKTPAAQTASWLRWLASGQSVADYHASFEGPLPWLANRTALDAFGFSLSRDVRFARHVREQTSAGDGVYVWSDPLINYLTDRPSPTPITAPEAFTIWGSEARRARYRDEFARAIRNGRAALIAVPAFALEPTGDPEFNLNVAFPELLHALDDAYEPAGEFENLRLFRPRRR